MGFVYCITNNINGKKYIGKTQKTVEKRFLEHKAESHRERSSNRPLYRAFNKYGVENFEVSVLCECENNKLCDVEAKYIEMFDTYKNGYNATIGGDGKPYLNVDKIIDDYKNVGVVKYVAYLNGCSQDSVSKILKDHNIDVIPSYNFCYREGYTGCINTPIKIGQIEKNSNALINTFESISSATKWLNENGYLKKISSGARSHIAQCLKGCCKSAYGFRWIKI